MLYNPYMKRSLFKWEMAGIGVIFLIGALFHFLFELTGSNPATGAFFPVNESAFEHLKMTFWPTVLWAAFTYRFLKSETKNFIIGKAAGLYAMPLVILLLFYGYTGATGYESVIIDILIFLVAIAIGQFISYKILKAGALPSWLSWVSIFLIIVLGFIYIFFTYNPAGIPLFLDTSTNSYGIP